MSITENMALDRAEWRKRTHLADPYQFGIKDQLSQVDMSKIMSIIVDSGAKIGYNFLTD